MERLEARGAPRPRAEGGAGRGRARAAQRFRFLRAYVTTFVVLGSYLWAGARRRRGGGDDGGAGLREVHRRNAARVRHTLLALQGLFIKVGQLLSILANFLPDEFRRELSALQDKVPPRPFDEIAARVAEELGAPVDELYAEFAREPIAAASLGQVHEARLKDGTRVVVKVQHPDIEAISQIDLRTMRRILLIVNAFFPVRGIDAYYSQLRELVDRELDFGLEAANLGRIAANFAADPMVRFPRVVDALSTKRVMTQTFVEGTKVGDLAALDALGVDRRRLAERVVRAYCQMVFVDGVYHADPHPGNLLVGPGGELVFLDFGAVAEVSRDMREGMPEFLEGVIRRDTDRLMRALKRMGFLAHGGGPADDEVAERVVEYFHRRFQEEVKLESFNLRDLRFDAQKGMENLLNLRRMNVTLRELTGAFQVPRDWVLLQRCFLLLAGVCTELDPGLNPFEVVRPYLQEFVLGNRDWAQIALEAVRDMALQAVTLPADARKVLQKAHRGELEVVVRAPERGARLVARAIDDAVVALAALGAGWAAVQFRLHGDAGPARACGWAAAALGAAWLGRVLFGRGAGRR
jgi:predicted unusual protein kinase regulating ubiquinone biosynthesis (AarF/ABC1/UbiB family)